MKITPEVTLTFLVVIGLAVMAAFGLTDRPVPDVVTYVITTAVGALVGRMLPGPRTPEAEPVTLVNLPEPPGQPGQPNQRPADRRVAQPEDRPWETR